MRRRPVQRLELYFGAHTFRLLASKDHHTSVAARMLSPVAYVRKLFVGEGEGADSRS